MAQSPTERLTALEHLVHGYTIRLDTLKEEVDALAGANSELAKALTALDKNFDRQVALLEREVEELKKWQDQVRKAREELGRKLWMIFPPLLAALLSRGLTAALTIYLRK